MVNIVAKVNRMMCGKKYLPPKAQSVTRPGKCKSLMKPTVIFIAK